jgi:predicted restriction endonuclease
MMLAAYEGRCAVTGCDATAALEAAHVTPYRGPETNHPLNGLLLRSDIHTLFDLGLLAVDADSMKILVARELSKTEYGHLAGKSLSTPKDSLLHPHPDCLKQHRDESKCKSNR